MSVAREEILRRVRSALVDVPAAERADHGAQDAGHEGQDAGHEGQDADQAPQRVDREGVARDYRRRDDRSPDQLIELLSQRLVDYHAGVQRVERGHIARAVSDAAAAMGLRRLVVAPALPEDWRPSSGLEVVEDRGLSAAELDAIDGALTGCAAAIAETGTLVLDGQGVSGRRVMTLVPDHHICVVLEDQVVGLVPEAIERLGPSVREHGVPVTLISGPSATSDIELTRVEGVHGPRHLRVLIVPGR